jgi:hypothetical protein
MCVPAIEGPVLGGKTLKNQNLKLKNQKCGPLTSDL